MPFFRSLDPAMQQRLNAFVAAALLLGVVVASAQPQQQADAFVAPPRTIVDITAILDQEKPDLDRIAKLRADADAQPPHDADAGTLVEFYYNRGVARSNVGRFRDSIADLKTGIALGTQHQIDVGYLQQLLGSQYTWSGDVKDSLDVILTLARESDTPAKRSYLFNAYRWISFLLIVQGDLDQAQRYLEKNESLLVEAQAWPNYSIRKYSYRANVEYTRGRLFEARGRLSDAEAAYRSAELDFTESLSQPVDTRQASRRWSVEQVRDNMIASQGVVKAKQGRYAEAEADARRALLNRLASVGKYNLPTATLVIPRFASILLDQGRYGEAEKLTRTQIDIFKALGVDGDSQYFVQALNNLASMQALQGQWSEAARTYAAIDEATESWDAVRKAQLVNIDRVLALYNAGHVAEGVAAGKQLLARSTTRFGPQHDNTAYAQAAVAVGLSRENRDAEALSAFRAAIPVVLSAAKDAESDDTINAAAREQRARILTESYMTLLARSLDSESAAAATFPLADAIRSRSVQLALTLSGARAVTGSPKLAELARREQDMAKQLAAQRELLNDFLARPRERRDEASIRELQTRIDALRAEHDGIRRQLAQEFPAYANLIDPHPPTVDAIRSALKPDEAFISFYLGGEHSFVWVIAPHRPLAFAAIDMTADDIAAKVKMLRAALEPQAALISDIPLFDLTLAYELYGLLLKPVEAGWKTAKSLVVATNGALGELPLGVLPTAPSQIDAQAIPLFVGYRNVPWLARSHAVTMIPSASALVTLRSLPPGSPQRDKLIAFGDPYFSAQQAAAAEEPAQPMRVASTGLDESSADTLTRGAPLKLALNLRASPHTEDADTATLSMLPRLADTRQELTAIARALGVEPANALYLGKEANERNVETMDLSRYRIVAFATHGLVPGDLDGLTEPALALTAPEVAGVTGDGLLTMSKILALKLDADWVVLSACNTAAGAGAGAEAASGLGRAFFYAGTRAVLVTNWSVHSASARQLVSDVFRRQAANPPITRGEALRQAMVAMIDGGGYIDDSGRVLFAYAHPLFWGPYSIIGDGG
jgi:CHAT domain-containing protein